MCTCQDLRNMKKPTLIYGSASIFLRSNFISLDQAYYLLPQQANSHSLLSIGFSILSALATVSKPLVIMNGAPSLGINLTPSVPCHCSQGSGFTPSPGFNGLTIRQVTSSSCFLLMTLSGSPSSGIRSVVAFFTWFSPRVIMV